MKKYSKQSTDKIGKSLGLALPKIDIPSIPPKLRTLDEINELIEQDYQLFYNRERMLEEKRKMSVYKKFTLT